ncbi:formyltransferase family protein [Pedobacter sp. MR22-3]|uniref:formyltransferase family protein n=1 Tax=Pedobacter sp. MR22-3 TaxID=2994552 RepID=UPI002246F8A9|nr:formyltransferase family protein [Pedobacter sp. MR22-3]MCX2583531.1 formyltransferase family protein [Pedobacter sp. MR22-3]
MKIAVICNSDSLAFPTVQALFSQGLLVGVAILERSSKVLLKPLHAIGLSGNQILQLHHGSWEHELKHWLTELDADAVWVFGFPWMIPDHLLESVHKGYLNFHFGELPKYRGADPIFWQIKNNEPYASLTVHQMTANIDAGPIVWVKQLPIMKGENYGLLCQRLGFMALDAIPLLVNNSSLLFGVNKNADNEERFEKRPGHQELAINWKQQSSDEIECLINAANPKYGGATAWVKNAEVRILEASPAEIQLPEGAEPEPGTIVYADALYGLIVSCRENRFLKINILHMREGYFSGSKLFQMGIKAGEKFINLN